MKHKLYTAEVAPELAEQFSDWRPITDLADEFKIVTHDDGTCELYFRVTPKTTSFSSNGDGQHQ